VSNNVFITAGGANFPNGLPWKGGKKYYSNEIFVLQKEDKKFAWNKKVKKSLPAPIAYCGVTSTDKGIVYAGGENENGSSTKSWIINWNLEDENIEIKPLPDLPLALTNVALTHIDDVVFAAGGDEAKKFSGRFFSLDLGDKNTEWKTLPD
jgi:N-acetylneuraminic acid mutarotase